MVKIIKYYCNLNKLLACVGAAGGNSESAGYFSDFVKKLELQIFLEVILNVII